ncbi:UNVERIFIED_CONTAM: E3 SUMO-protein ligase SIZ1 [Sesamum angustifolium]|uniref:E3 SUMO-protein ligase SIZ1 n=1 Tax=Sesamum angustifolium TaxID=2727405 RepID=A0AAW2QPK5_9LAMI
MQVSGAADLASKSQAVSDSSTIRPKEETEDRHQMEKIRCLCGSTLPTDSMIKCEDPRCNVWQHMACVLIPEKPTEGILPNPPDIFYCEVCRLSRADPFWVTVAHPLYPVKLNITNVPADGSNPSQSIEKTFSLARTDRDLLSKQEYDVQAWCMLLNDKVPFRMQWPQYADLQLNGVPVRAINRPGSQLLGANGRDDGPVITPCTRDGLNKIFVGGCDARIFCMGVRIAKRHSLQQIEVVKERGTRSLIIVSLYDLCLLDIIKTSTVFWKPDDTFLVFVCDWLKQNGTKAIFANRFSNMIPKEDEAASVRGALARVRRCVGGGAPQKC